MASDSERFWPSLLTRLRSEDRTGLPLDDHFLSAQQLRDSVKHDLENLFNATNLESTSDLSGYDHVRRSILNYGVPDLTGKLAYSLDAGTLERQLREVIISFEPRLRPETVQVRISTLTDKGDVDPERPIMFEIVGDIHATPVPERIFMRSVWDVELNKAMIEVD